MKNYIGIDIGGTKCAVSVGKYDGNDISIVSRIRFDTDNDASPYVIIDKFIEIIEKEMQFEAIGISCGGPLECKKGVILCPPNLPKWIDVPIVEILNKKFSVPVYLQNDANACALAEWKLGAGKGTSNMVFLTFGTGFGAGLILNGRLYCGANDMAGEIGHIRLSDNGPEGYGKKGSAEGYCSGCGISNLGRMCGLDKSAKELAILADGGDKTATDIYCTSGKYLGRAISILLDLINPECIVIGSIFARSEKLLREAMENEILKESLEFTRTTCKIKAAQLGDRIGDYAALITAVYANQ